MAVGKLKEIHHERYALAKILPIEEVAKRHQVNEDTIRESIARVETHLQLNTPDHLRTDLIGVIRETVEDVKKVVKQGLKAKANVYNEDGSVAKDSAGNVLMQVDLPTRLKTLDRVNTIASSLINKGGGIQINNNMSQVTATQFNGTSVESLMRGIRSKVATESQSPSLVASLVDDEAEVAEDGDDTA